MRTDNPTIYHSDQPTNHVVKRFLHRQLLFCREKILFKFRFLATPHTGFISWLAISVQTIISSWNWIFRFFSHLTRFLWWIFCKQKFFSRKNKSVIKKIKWFVQHEAIRSGYLVRSQRRRECAWLSCTRKNSCETWKILMDRTLDFVDHK